MRVVSLHPDVLVATSAIWQTNCTIVRSGEESFVIDSPVLPEELEVLPSLLDQAGFPPLSGLLATHGDWDHLLGRLAFPDAALGCAQSTVDRLAGELGEAQRQLRDFDRRFYIQRPRPLMLGQLQTLRVPGRCSIGAQELELHPAEGHTPDGMVVWIPWARVLVAGDYISPIELPQIAEGLAGAYATTLARLRPLAAAAASVVPGHGAVLTAERALSVLDGHAASLTQKM